MTTHLLHRSATAADLGEVIDFPQTAEELFFCYPKAIWPLNVGQLAAAIAERRESTVVELDGKVAGFANFYQWQHGAYCALGNLMVAPWARGQGVAQHLVAVMERLACQRYKAPLMKVSCFNANAAGLLLYAQLGYHPVGIVERSTTEGGRVALIQLEKTLSAPLASAS